MHWLLHRGFHWWTAHLWSAITRFSPYQAPVESPQSCHPPIESWLDWNRAISSYTS
jgi:hypothetical protein